MTRQRLVLSALLLLLFCGLPRAAGAQVAYISAITPDTGCPPNPPPGYEACTRGDILVVDSATGSPQATVNIWRSSVNRRYVFDLEINEAGTRLYVAVMRPVVVVVPGLPMAPTTELHVFDVTTLVKVASREDTIGASAIAVSRDGSTLAMSFNILSSNIHLLDAETLALETVLPDGFPSDLVYARDGSRLYVSKGAAITVRSLPSYAGVATIPLPSSAFRLSVSTDGAHLYAVLGDGTVADIHTATATLSSVISDFGPGGGVVADVTSANHQLWVTVRAAFNSTAQERIVVLDQDTHAVVHSFAMARPVFIAAGGDQRRVLATNPGTEWKTFDTQSGSVVVTAPGIGTSMETHFRDNRVAFGPVPPYGDVRIDVPAASAVVTQPFDLGGWAVRTLGFSDGPGISGVNVTATRQGGSVIDLGAAEYFRPRPDIAAIFGVSYLRSGYLTSVNGLEPGSYILTARAIGTGGSPAVIERSIPAIVQIASPTATLTRNPATLNFGAKRNGLNGVLTTVTPPQQVTIGFSGTSPTWHATSDQPWAIVTNGTGTGAGRFTVSIDNTNDPIGSATTLTATLTIAAPNANPIFVVVHLNVVDAAAGTPPAFGMVDTPMQFASGLTGAIGVTGWALDDVGVTAIKVYRECLPFDAPSSCVEVAGTSLVYIGDAAFLAGARPDVEAMFPSYPHQTAAGWGMRILSNMLPDVPNGQPFGGQGTIAVHVFAIDEEGHLTRLGRTPGDATPTFLALNNHGIARPFGTIDTPALAETVSGTIANFGWVLTPDTNLVADGTDIVIPTDGATITVFIDGVATAVVGYNQCRGSVGTPPPGGVFCDDDVANVFGNATPQPPLTPRSSNPTRFRNLDAGRGAIGVFTIDTTTLANGLHTIAWSVTDSANRVEGIGSRFFTVLNSGGQGAETTLEALLAAPAIDRGLASRLDGLRVSSQPLSVRTGFDPRAPMARLPVQARGIATVAVPVTGRVEVALARPVEAGYLVVNGALRDLPVGSHLDAATGVFSWTPPPGMFGTYRIALVAGREKVVFDISVGKTGR